MFTKIYISTQVNRCIAVKNIYNYKNINMKILLSFITKLSHVLLNALHRFFWAPPKVKANNNNENKTHSSIP